MLERKCHWDSTKAIKLTSSLSNGQFYVCRHQVETISGVYEDIQREWRRWSSYKEVLVRRTEKDGTKIRKDKNYIATRSRPSLWWRRGTAVYQITIASPPFFWTQKNSRVPFYIIIYIVSPHISFFSFHNNPFKILVISWLVPYWLWVLCCFESPSSYSLKWMPSTDWKSSSTWFQQEHFSTFSAGQE